MTKNGREREGDKRGRDKQEVLQAEQTDIEILRDKNDE